MLVSLLCASCLPFVQTIRAVSVDVRCVVTLSSFCVCLIHARVPWRRLLVRVRVRLPFLLAMNFIVPPLPVFAACRLACVEASLRNVAHNVQYRTHFAFAGVAFTRATREGASEAKQMLRIMKTFSL